jgi:hypothetical protein
VNELEENQQAAIRSVVETLCKSRTSVVEKDQMLEAFEEGATVT